MLCGKNKSKQLFWIVKHLFNCLATLVKHVFGVGPLSNTKKVFFCSLVWGIYTYFKYGLSAWSEGLCDLFPSCVAQGRSPRATHEGNESHEHELKAGKWLIFYIGEDSSLPINNSDTFVVAPKSGILKTLCNFELSFWLNKFVYEYLDWKRSSGW